MSESETATSPVDDLADSLKEQVTISPPNPIDDKNVTSESNVSQVDLTNVKTNVPSSTSTDFHLVKWIDFNFEILPILLQNINGPCPLLAIFNILLLRKRVKNDLSSFFSSSFKIDSIRLFSIEKPMPLLVNVF